MDKEYYLQEGMKLLQSGEFYSAKEVFTECLKLDLKDVNSIISLAKAEYALGNYHKAIYLLKESFKLNNSAEILKLQEKILNYISLNNIPEKLITVAYIVKNEEKSLTKSIQSILSIADEIIVVDTGSEDNTLEIAKQFGAKIYNFNWTNNYSEARNISIKYSTSKWILYLDADEELSLESSEIIRKLAESAIDTTAGFVCEIISEYIKDNGEIGHYSGLYPRFFRNIAYPILHFFGTVHEQITPSLYEFGYEHENSELKILHHGYAISRIEMENKLKQHLKTLSLHVENEPENAYTWYHLGNTLFQMKKFPESKPILENSLKCGNLSNYLSANTALLLSRICEQLKEMKSAHDYLDLSLTFIPNYKYSLIRKAELIEKYGDNK